MDPAVLKSFLKIDTPIAVASRTGTSIFLSISVLIPFQIYFADIMVVYAAEIGYGSKNFLP